MHQVVCKIKQGSRSVALSGALTLIAYAAVLSQGLQAQQVSETDVQAVLKRCGQCHGPTLQMSKLDLSTREAMLKGGEKGPAIVPGNAEASPLYRRISGLQAPAMPMPPVPALNAQEVELVKNWINQGAKMTAVAAPTVRLRPPLAPLRRTRVDTLRARSRMRIAHGGLSRSRCAIRRRPFAMPSGAKIRSTPSLPRCGNRRV